jgi:acetyl esterase/lipase
MDMKLQAWLAAAGVMAITVTAFGAALPKEEPLWPDGVPDKAIVHKQAEKNSLKVDPKTGKAGGGASFVSVPTMMVFPADKAKATRAAVVVYPGGGYRTVVLGKEGVSIAQRLNEMGITAVVVKYRTLALADPNARPTREIYEAQGPSIIADGQQAIRIVRSRAAELGVDPNKIGVMGFSAGAHLSGMLLVTPGEAAKGASNPVAKVSCRPDFACMIYGGLGRERFSQLKSGTAPCFLAIATDDSRVEPNSVTEFYDALLKAKVPTELHIYQSGGHGFGMGKAGETNALWMEQFGLWLRQNGLVRR